MKNLKDKVHSGVKWVSISLFVIRLSRFAGTIVLARLLMPEMFGIMAMAESVVRIIYVLQEMGFGQAYIQRRDTDKEDQIASVNTTFLISYGLNFAVFIPCQLFAPDISNMLDMPDLLPVLRVLVFIFLITPFTDIQVLMLQKELSFGKLSIAEIVHGISHVMISCCLAFLGYGVWSLVFGTLGSRVLFAILLLRQTGWRPITIFNIKIAKELFSFGKYIWCLGMLSAAGRFFDKAIVGKFWGVNNLGYYNLSLSLCHLLVELIDKLIHTISFPVFSMRNQDKDALENAIRVALMNVTNIAFPIGFGLISISHLFVPIVYGEKWMPIVPLVNVLAIYTIVQCVTPITGNVLKAVGKPQSLLYLSLFHHILLFSLFLLFKNYETIGICYAVVITVTTSGVISFLLIIHVCKIKLKYVFGPVLRTLASSYAMYYIVKVFQNNVIPEGFYLIIKLMCSIMVGIISFFISSLILNKSALLKTIRTIYQVVTVSNK
jgi:O-antigen/teichoic acid export membrane protein